MKKNYYEGYVFILPIAILLISFYVLPIIISFILGFTNYRGLSTFEFIGINNYKDIITDRFFIEALKNTLFYAVVITPLQTVLSLVLAVLAHKASKTITGKVFKVIMFIPVVSSMILVSVVWRILLNGDMSPLNQLFEFFHLSHPNWLQPGMAKITIIIINIWKNVGYFMLIYIAALSQIPTSYYEAAKIDGASVFSEFRYITIPLLKPATILVVFLSTMWSLQIFDLIYMLTGGGPGNATISIVMRIYQVAFKEYNIGYAMSMANILLVITAIVAILQRKLINKESSEI